TITSCGTWNAILGEDLEGDRGLSRGRPSGERAARLAPLSGLHLEQQLEPRAAVTWTKQSNERPRGATIDSGEPEAFADRCGALMTRQARDKNLFGRRFRFRGRNDPPELEITCCLTGRGRIGHTPA